MNIIILLNSLEGGGAEKVVLDLCSSFKEEGDKVDLILLYKSNYYREPEGINVIYLMEEKPKNILIKIFSIFVLALKLKNVIKKIETESKTDLFFSHLPFSNYITWLIGIKNHFAVVHSVYSNKYKSKLKRRLISFIHKNKKLIAVSQNVKKDLINNFSLKEKDIKVIYNPINIDKIIKLSKEPIEYNKPYIIHVGRFNKIKRHDILLKAYNETNLKDYYDLVLLGDGKERDNIRSLIKNLNIQSKVKLLGWQSNPYKWIKNASLLVLSSDSEGLPMVLIESLICNTPIVSTNNGGAQEIMIDELSNFLVPVGDYIKLAKKMDIAIKHYPSIKKSYYERFNPKKIISQYKGLMDEF